MATYTLDQIKRAKKTYSLDDVAPKKEGSFMDKRSGMDNFLAGFGKSIFDTGRGLGNLVGLVSDDEIKQARELDKHLMDSPSGVVGNIAGHAGQLLAPGGLLASGSKALGGIRAADVAAKALLNPQTYKTAAGIGAGYSAIQPATSLQERAINTAAGGAGGAGGLFAGRLLQGGLQGVGSVVEPLTKGGKQKIVSRYIADQVGDTDKLAKSLSKVNELVPGSQVTTPEAAMHPSVSQMSRTMQNTDNIFNARIREIEQAQNNARVNAIQSLKQGSTKQLRDDMAKAATKRFKGVDVDIDPIRKMVSGMKKQNKMDESAIKVLNHVESKLDDDMDLSQLYDLRKTLTSDKLSKLDGFDARTIVNIRNSIDDIAEKQSPVYKAYMDKYKELSKPINQNAVLDEVMNRAALPMQNTAEQVRMGANQLQLSPAKMAGAMKADQSLVAKATKYKKSPNMRETLTPEQLSTLRKVNADLTRSSKAASLGKATGSNTAQNLAGENMLKRSLGSVLPDNLINHLATGLPGRTANFVYNGSNQAMNDLLADALIDPNLMRQLLIMSNSRNVPQNLLNSLGTLGYVGGVAAPAGLLGQ